jgi:enoyl-[acyl-carrier protein] reductase I
MTCNLLRGKRGIIFGALNEASIAWAVAKKCHEEGAVFTLTNTPAAIRFGNLQVLAEEVKSEIIPADAASFTDLEMLYNKSIEILGGKIDFVLHSIGMSKNVLKNRHYTDLNHHDFISTLDISAISLYKILKVAYKHDFLNEHASVVAMTYIGASRVFDTYSDMSNAKSLLESIVKNFGYHYGLTKKIRINSVSQSPTISSAAKAIDGFDTMYEFANKMSPLGNASSEECAGLCVALFSDLTRKVTMQNIYHDGGFNSVGISREMLERLQLDKE